jgi:hypothetical protein
MSYLEIRVRSLTGFNKSIVNNIKFIIPSVAQHLLWFVEPFPRQAAR